MHRVSQSLTRALSTSEMLLRLRGRGRLSLPSADERFREYDSLGMQSESEMARFRLVLSEIRKHHKEESLPSLVQMLQHRPWVLRSALVDALANVDGSESTRMLAQRALYEPEDRLRLRAVEALKGRAPEDYQPALLEGLRYPLPAVAYNAARAIVALKATNLVPQLERLREAPDPASAFVDDQGRVMRRELVRVNHLSNCVLCHAASSSTSDLVRGAIPIPGSPLPIRYYHKESGPAVRADVTYLRQDFSLTHVVDESDTSRMWALLQRFDYVVQIRELPPGEPVREPTSDPYPQRDAVLAALAELKKLGE